MNKPMTTLEASERFKCDCPAGSDCECLLESTCSYHCPYCHKRIWFPSYVGNHGNPRKADCPYCGKETLNLFPERKN